MNRIKCACGVIMAGFGGIIRSAGNRLKDNLKLPAVGGQLTNSRQSLLFEGNPLCGLPANC